MTIKSHEEIVIYESTDGGKTIYSRKSGSSDRSMVVEDTTQHHYITKWYEWKEILKLAETEPSLANAISKAEMLYVILKKEQN